VAYLSLYRRRRPLTFADMTGQEHITRTLSNALCSGRLAHAYLFCGPRGTGKTTAAKILARSMNCEHYPVAEPCGKCVPCKNISAGSSIDVIEMDAASNRGIDEIRELRERSRFASGESRYKVYIIDEAHMLTPEAGNAFLKTLEEPPQNVVFILATTDPSRLPSTIVSRCQRFDFHLLTVEQIRQRLLDIIKKEEWQADEEAVTLIARLADGSLRDALGILEQCSAYGEEKINAAQVRIVTGATMVDTIESMVKAAVENNLDLGLSTLEEVVFSGRDLNLFMRDLTFVFTRLLLSESSRSGQSANKMHGFEELVSRYHGKIESNLLLDVVELLHEVSSELRHAHFPRYILEVGFIRLVRLIHGRVKPASVLYSTAAAEPAVTQDGKQETAASPVETAGKPDTRRESEKVLDAEKKVKPEDVSAGNEAAADESGETVPAEDRTAKLKDAWPRLLEEVKRRQKSTAAWLDPARLVECSGHMVKLQYSREYAIHQIRIMEDSHRKIVETILSAFCGDQISIKAEVVDKQDEEEKLPEDKAQHLKTEAVEDTQRKDEPEQFTAEQPEPAEQKESDGLPSASEEQTGSNKKKTPKAEEAMELFGGKLIDTD